VVKGDTFTVTVRPKIFQIDDKKTGLERGEHSFVQIISTWSDYTNLAKELRSEWASNGMLFWPANLVAEPRALNIGNLKKEECYADLQDSL